MKIERESQISEWSRRLMHTVSSLYYSLVDLTAYSSPLRQVREIRVSLMRSAGHDIVLPEAKPISLSDAFTCP